MTPKAKINMSDKLENWLKVLSFLLTGVTFCWGVFQYKIDNERNFRKYAFEKQSEVYNNYLSICSQLAITDKDSVSTNTFQKQYQEFEKIHFGDMALVQDTSVFSVATLFYVELNKFRQKASPTTNNDLQIILEDLAKKCRFSLRETWTQDFDKIFSK